MKTYMVWAFIEEEDDDEYQDTSTPKLLNTFDNEDDSRKFVNGLAATPDLLDNHIYNVKALQGYSRWIPSTPTESELINAIKYSVKRSKDAIKKATE